MASLRSLSTEADQFHRPLSCKFADPRFGAFGDARNKRITTGNMGKQFQMPSYVAKTK